MSVNKILDQFPATIQATKELTQKQKDVLIASIQLFAKQGYANTSTHQIAVAAHQSEGTMFKRFKSKANILRVALEPVIFQIIPDVAAELKKDTLSKPFTNLHDFLIIFVQNRMEFAEANQDAIKVFFSELLYNENLRQEFIDVARDQFIVSFEGTVTKLQKHNLIIDWPFTMIFRYIASVVAGYILDRYVLFPNRDWNDDNEAKYLVAELEKVLQPEQA